MTNLSPGPSQRRITRDLILVSVPLLLGGVVSAGLWWWQLRPVQQRVEALEVRRDDLTAQQRRLPALHRRVEEARKEQARAEQQQAVLLDLIAGSDRVQTFLAMLDQLARTTGVAIQRFEPLSVTRPPSPATAQAGNKGKRSKPPPAPSDPFLRLGYRKTFVALNLSGTYAAVQLFLQQMESLELVVEGSELRLQGATEASDDDDRPLNTIELAFRLSFYDRELAVDGETDADPIDEPLS